MRRTSSGCRRRSIRARGIRSRMQVVIDSLTGIWMPTAGRVASVEFDGDRAAALAEGFYYSASAAAGLQTAGGGLAPGDAFVVSGADPAVPAVAALQPPGVPAGALPLPESLAAWVEEHQEGSAGVALDGLVRLLRERGYLSHALSMGETPARWAQALPGYAFQSSASGHSLARIDAMFASLLARESDPRGRGIRRLRRGDRRRRAVQRRRGAHRAGPRLSGPGGRRGAAELAGRDAADLRRRHLPRAGPRGVDRGAERERRLGADRCDPAVRESAEPRRLEAARPRERHRCAPRDGPRGAAAPAGPAGFRARRGAAG